MQSRLVNIWKWISEKMKQKSIRQGYFLVIIIASIGFISYAAYLNWDEVKIQTWDLDYKYIVASIVLFPIGFLPCVAVWHKLLEGFGWKLPYRINLRIYAISALPRHIPGLVWYISSRSMLYLDEGVPAGVVIAATAFEVFLHATSGFVMASLVLLRSTAPLENYPALRFVIPGALLFLVVLVASSPYIRIFQNWFIKRWKYDLFPNLSRSNVVASLIWLFFAWCGGGVLLFLLVRGLVVLPLSYLLFMIGAWSLSSAIGLTIGIGVSGIGLREVSLAAILSLVMPPITAVVAAIAFRLVLLVGELFWILILVWVIKIVPPNAKDLKKDS